MGLTGAELMAIQAGSQVSQAGINALTSKKQFERQKELMALQMANQKELNIQGHRLQKEMWDITNAKAQMENLKKAGLNPSLMYASGGAQGVTGSQGGGAAASLGAQMAHPMDIGNLGAQMANIKLAEAQANNLDADTDKKKGVETELDYARIADLTAGVNLKKAQKLLVDADTNLKKATEKFTLQQMNESYARMMKTAVETGRELIQLGVDKATAETKIKMIQQEWELNEWEKVVKAAGVKKTKQEILKMKSDIRNDLTRLGLDKENIDLTKDKNKVAEFEAETKRKYPSIFNVVGSLGEGMINRLKFLTGTREHVEFDYVEGTDKTWEKHKTTE